MTIKHVLAALACATLASVSMAAGKPAGNAAAGEQKAAACGACPGAQNTELLAQGERIFFKGKGRPDVIAACVGCHGLNGVGNRDWAKTMSNVPAVLAPAIGGQHAGYLGDQLKAYKSGKRATDPARVMRDIAGRMDEKDIAAVAEYIATLGR